MMWNSGEALSTRKRKKTYISLGDTDGDLFSVEGNTRTYNRPRTLLELHMTRALRLMECLKTALIKADQRDDETIQDHIDGLPYLVPVMDSRILDGRWATGHVILDASTKRFYLLVLLQGKQVQRYEWSSASDMSWARTDVSMEQVVLNGYTTQTYCWGDPSLMGR